MLAYFCFHPYIILRNAKHFFPGHVPDAGSFLRMNNDITAFRMAEIARHPHDYRMYVLEKDISYTEVVFVGVTQCNS